MCGKVRYVGVSNVTGWQFQKIIDMGRQLGLNQIVSNQVWREGEERGEGEGEGGGGEEGEGEGEGEGGGGGGGGGRGRREVR